MMIIYLLFLVNELTLLCGKIFFISLKNPNYLIQKNCKIIVSVYINNKTLKNIFFWTKHF